MTFASYYDLSKLNLFILDDNKFMRKVLETMCDALSAKELYRRLVWIIENPTPLHPNGNLSGARSTARKPWSAAGNARTP